jgi:thioredoxin 2
LKVEGYNPEREKVMDGEEVTYLIRCASCHTVNRVPAESEGKAGRCGNCHALLQPLFTRPVQLSDRSFDGFARDFPGAFLAEFWAPW